MESGKLKFNKDRDRFEVDQFGYIDLREAFVSHTIPASVAIEDLDYNDIEDPQSIVGKPRDVFDAIQKREGIIQNGVASAEGSQEESAD